MREVLAVFWGERFYRGFERGLKGFREVLTRF